MELKSILGKFNEIYGNKYIYDEIGEPKNTASKICIVCPNHGTLYKTVNNHLQGQGFPKCKKEESLKKGYQNLVEEGTLIHKGKYDYSELEYLGGHVKTRFICPEHGEFWQTPSSHLQGCGCPKCANKDKTLEEVINKCKEIHGDKYEYSLLTSPNLIKVQKIKCNRCGRIFEMTLSKHIYGKNGCKFCNHRSYAYTTEESII